MSQEQHKKDKLQSDGIAQQPGIKSESSGTSGSGGKHDPNAPNSSSGAMSGQGTFGSGQNGPGMKQNQGKSKKEKLGYKKFPDGPGDPEAAQEGLI